MSNNEDSTAMLGDSEELRVKHPPSPKIPEFLKRPEEGTKVPSA
jgi:hypothetical protein